MLVFVAVGLFMVGFGLGVTAGALWSTIPEPHELTLERHRSAKLRVR